MITVRIGRAFRTAALAGVLAAGAITLPAAAAHATPDNCSSGYWEGSGGQSGWWAYCSKQTNPGTDRWRAVAVCDRQGRTTTTVYGPWTGGVAAGRSIAVCPSGYDAVSGSYQKSG
jgi:hypothetical protein